MRLVLLMWSSTVDCVKWTVYNDQRSTGSERLPDYQSVSSCQNYCVQQSDCVAVEFEDRGSRCSMHTNIYNLRPANTPTGVLGVTQYRISRTCGQQAPWPTGSRTANLTTGRYHALNTEQSYGVNMRVASTYKKLIRR